MVKPEIRVVGIDDGVHIPRMKGLVPIVGVVFRGGYWLDGVMSTMVKVDGFDATSAISNMITFSPHYKQLRVIMLSGITFAGFNVVNLAKLYEATKIPVIAVTRGKPDMAAVTLAVKNLSKSKERMNSIYGAGELFEVQIGDRKKIYMQIAGVLREDAQKIIKLTSTRSDIPEPLRVAHLIASGISICSTGLRKGIKETMLRDSKTGRE